MHGLTHSTALSDALVILGVAGIIIPAFAKFRITPVIGFILAGIAVGPFGLGAMVPQWPWLYHVTITDPAAMTPFAEFGIILLLFTIGLELSAARLWTMRRRVFGIGASELAGGAVAIAVCLVLAGQPWTIALVLGVALSLSSTALVLPMTGTTGHVGRNAFAMLLFEDLALVPILFLLAAIGTAASGTSMLPALLTVGWQSVAVILLLAAAGRWLLPPLFAQAARAKNPELFLAISLLAVIGAALATSSVGLSPVIGALIAGVLIAETDYAPEIASIIGPFKGLALAVFLITVGMSVDLAAVAADWPRLLIAVAGVLTVKAIVTGLMLRIVGVRRGTAAETAVLMASPSETTLIVLAAAVQAGVLAADIAAFWQLVTAIGLTITPLLARAGRAVSRRIDRAIDADPLPDGDTPLVLLLGFGRVGRVVADLLRRHGRAFIAYEADIDAVARGQARGYPVRFGDAGHADFLDRFGGVPIAAVALTMDDPVQQARLTRRLRARYPDLPIVTRARDTAGAAQLYAAGATDAVPETLEGSLQMAEAVLTDIGVAAGPVIASVHDMRADARAAIRTGASAETRTRIAGRRPAKR